MIRQGIVTSNPLHMPLEQIVACARPGMGGLYLESRFLASLSLTVQLRHSAAGRPLCALACQCNDLACTFDTYLLRDLDQCCTICLQSSIECWILNGTAILLRDNNRSLELDPVPSTVRPHCTLSLVFQTTSSGADTPASKSQNLDTLRLSPPYRISN